jgi:phenylalanyl-tRNA synthetase beta chain
VELPLREVRRLLGDRFDLETSAAFLRRLSLDVEAGNDTLRVTVPTFRPDLTRPADLVEEIARLADYDSFPATVPTGPAGHLSPPQHRLRRLQELMRGIGLYQAINLPFVAGAELTALGIDTEVVTVKNPLRDDQAKLRPSLLPALLRNLRDNRNRGAASVGLFEIGRVFFSRPSPEDERVPDQPSRLAVAILGPFGTSRLDAAAAQADGGSALAVVDALARGLGVPLERTPAALPGLHPARAAHVVLDDEVIGIVGELHPDVVELFDLTGRVAVMEIDVDPVIAPRHPAQMRVVSTFPHVDFDLSFDMPGTLPAAELVAATASTSDLVERADVFDEYRHPDRGTHSLAVRYRLRAPDRTLKSDEIATVRARMIEAAAERGAALRGTGAEDA